MEQEQKETRRLIDKYGGDKIIATVKQLNKFRKLYNVLCRRCKRMVFNAVQEGREERVVNKDNYCSYCQQKLIRFMNDD